MARTAGFGAAGGIFSVTVSPEAALQALRGEDRRSGGLAVAEREAVLDALVHHLLERREALARAVASDFGRRGREETLIAEVLAVVNAARHARRRLRRWSRPRRAGVPVAFWPSSAWMVPQPLGVVAILAPWNYPLHLALLPLLGALAAGNRAVVKPAEATPRTAEALAALIEASAGPAVARTVLGGPEVAAAMVRLPFDHILFTGSAAHGREVMRAAADHLTPVTLELGGKCPAILLPDADLERAARALVLRKALNAGQTCVAPDTLLVVDQPLEPVQAALRRAFARHFPDGLPTALISQAQRDRLVRQVGGQELESLGPDPATSLALACEPPPASALLREEVFGPVLPMRSMASLEAALAWLADLAAPLAVYLFTRDPRAERIVLERTRAGALVVNDALVHAAMETLPFGGVGGSGFGRYHGRAGFDTFSNQRVHVRAARANLARLLDPPYDRRKLRLLERLLGA